MKTKPKTTKTQQKQPRRKYIESHWLIFGIQGIITLLSGWYILFTPSTDTRFIITVIGSVLLALSLVELFNILHRHRRQHSWFVPLGVAILEAAVGITLLITNNLSYELHIAILAGYTLLRSFSSIVVGFMDFKNLTDRFFWVVSGMVGAVIGFVILADPGISDTMFTKFFGTYLMILGLTHIFYAAHSRDQLKPKN